MKVAKVPCETLANAWAPTRWPGNARLAAGK